MLGVIIISVLFIVGYAALMLTYRKGWLAKNEDVLADYTPNTMISVIIPARNEEQNIQQCIRSVLEQDYPTSLLEVIVIDDHSEDNTYEAALALKNTGRVSVLKLADHLDGSDSTVAFKKRALTLGIEKSKGELIVTTDADCIAGEQWIANIAAVYERQDPAMIVAPVDFSNKNNLVEIFQSLDFMSMQGITVASLELGLGNMSNGANLAFKKSAFNAVGGYEGVDNLASGDDYLLMMKINNLFPSKISFLKAKDAIVYTPPQPDWKGFFQQRIRWASKSGKYDDKKMTFILSFVYLFNLLFLVLAVLSFFYGWYFFILVNMLLIKIEVELIYLFPVAKFYNKSRQLYIFPFLQPLHILYIISAGLLGFIGVYSWKGRKVK